MPIVEYTYVTDYSIPPTLKALYTSQLLLSGGICDTAVVPFKVGLCKTVIGTYISKK